MFIPLELLSIIALNVVLGIYGTASVWVESSKYKYSKFVVLIPPASRLFEQLAHIVFLLNYMID
mgnify:CR=1 FL=1